MTELRSVQLHALLAWSDDPKGLIAEWNRPGTPRLPATNRVQRGRPVSLVVIFDGCRADAAGKCVLTGSITFSDPTGKTSATPLTMPIWNAAAPPAGRLILSPATLAMTFDDTDPLGAHTFRVTIVDEVSGASVSGERPITVIETPGGPTAPSRSP